MEKRFIAIEEAIKKLSETVEACWRKESCSYTRKATLGSGIRSLLQSINSDQKTGTPKTI